jgi:hypothetical protein
VGRPRGRPAAYSRRGCRGIAGRRSCRPNCWRTWNRPRVALPAAQPGPAAGKVHRRPIVGRGGGSPEAGKAGRMAKGPRKVRSVGVGISGDDGEHRRTDLGRGVVVGRAAGTDDPNQTAPVRATTTVVCSLTCSTSCPIRRSLMVAWDRVQGNHEALRALGIPTAADRVVQAALKLVLEPIFEATFTRGPTGSARSVGPRTRSLDPHAGVQRLRVGVGRRHHGLF